MLLHPTQLLKNAKEAMEEFYEAKKKEVCETATVVPR
jgi:hypothetical protein